MWARGGRRWRRNIPIRLALVVAAAPLFSPSPAAAAADELAAQIAPSSLVLEPGDAVRIDLVLSNPAEMPVTVSRIDVRTPPRLVARAVSGPLAPRVIPAGGSARSELELRAEPGIQDGEAAVITEYRYGSSARVVTAALTVKAADAAAMPEVTFVAAPEKVNDGQTRDAVVRIFNPTPMAYGNVTLLAIDSDDLDVELAGAPLSPFIACRPGAVPQGSGRPLACLDQLASGAAQVVDLRIRAHDRVRTGKQRVGVRFTGTPVGEPSASAPASRAPGAAPTGSSASVSPSAGSSATGTPASADALPAANVIGTADVELTVFGVDALSPFGVGTLFVLPGILAVVLFLLLARYVYPRRPGLPDSIGLTDLRALPIVVPIAVLAYLLVWLLFGRNLTVAVGTLDVALLFGLGLLIGFLAWAAMAGTWYERVGRKQFTLADSPDTVLKRLGVRKSRLVLPEVPVSNVRHLYLSRTAGGALLVCPQLAYTILGDPQDPSTEEHAKAFRKAMRRDDIDAVRRSRKAGQVAIRWDGPSNLTEIDGTAVQLGANEPLLVERSETA